MALEGTKKLPTLRPSRDLKLTGTNKPQKTVFIPNIPSNRKRPQPSSLPTETSELLSDKLDSNHTKTSAKFNKKLKPNNNNMTVSDSERQIPDLKREREMKKRKNNVFVTTSIFSCGLAEKVVRKKENKLTVSEDLKDSAQHTTTTDISPEREQDREYPEEILDPYDDSVPRMIPLDKSLSTKSLDKQMMTRGDKMLSLWSSKPRFLDPLWPGLEPTPMPEGEVGDRSLASDLFNPSDEKAQILFLQIPDKFPVLKPLNPEDSLASGGPDRLASKTELSSLRHLPQGSAGQVRVHKSGRVSMQIGDAAFDILNATPAAFLQELVVIDHPPGSSQGHLTHLGYLSGRMVCSPDLEALTTHSPFDNT